MRAVRFHEKIIDQWSFLWEKITKYEDFPDRQVMTIIDNLCLWLAGCAPF